MAAGSPPPLPNPKKGNSALAWVALGCGGILLIALVILIGAVVELAVLMGFGLVAAIVLRIVSLLLSAVPITFDLSSWYAGSGLAALGILMALFIYGFRTSLGGRRVFEFADI